MKNLFIVFIVSSFIGIVVFGFLAMGEHGPGHSLNGCIAALQEEINCPVFEGLVSFASFHLNAFKVFSSANLIATATILLFFLAALIFLTTLVKQPFDFGLLKHKSSAALTYSSDYGFCMSSEVDLKSWLALHEMRDTVFSV